MTSTIKLTPSTARITLDPNTSTLNLVQSTGKIDLVDNNGITLSEQAALHAASSPSAANPFVTASSVNVASGKTLTVNNSTTIGIADGYNIGANSYSAVTHTIYAIGDSLTAGYNLTLDGGGYVNTLQSSLGYGWSICNFGVDGYNTINIQSVLTNVINAADGHYVIVWGGINDVMQGYSAVTIEGRLQAIYTAAHNAGLKVVAINLAPFKNYSAWNSGYQTILNTVNTWIANTASNIDYKVNVYTLLTDGSDALQTAYDSGDHLHLTAAGYAAVGAAIYSGVTWAQVISNKLTLANTGITLNQSLANYDTPNFSGLNSGAVHLNTNGYGYGTYPLYAFHAVGNVNQSFAGMFLNNVNQGNAACSSFFIGEDLSTKYLVLNVFGSNYYDPTTKSSAAFIAASGLTNGLSFTTATTAPIIFKPNNTAALTLAGSGAATFASSVSASSLDLFTGSGAVLGFAPNVSTGYGNYLYWQRSSDGWTAGQIGQNYTGSGSGYGARLVFGINRGNNPTDIVQALSLAHNGTNVIINMANLPTSAAGLSTGDLYVSSGQLMVA